MLDAARSMPHAPSALAAFMAADPDFRGIGAARAAALDEAFGASLPGALDAQDPRFFQILGDELALETMATFAWKRPEAALLSWLDEEGISNIVGHAAAIRIARAWGNQGVAAIQSNPYLLTTITPFRTVDAIGNKLGIAADDERRLSAVVEEVLKLRLDAGHTWTSRTDLSEATRRMLDCSTAIACHAIDTAVRTHGAVELDEGIQPPGAAEMERFVVSALRRIAGAEPSTDLLLGRPSSEQIDRQIALHNTGRPYRLTDRQEDAIRLATTGRFTVIAGYAGSGKTATLAGLCDVAESFGRTVHLMALSGRAAQRITASTGHEATTIARFLKAIIEAHGRPLGPEALLVIDEASMLDLPTLWRILRKIGDASLVLVGDPAQLPPIGFGLTFHALVGASGIPQVCLDRVHRQSEASGIPTVAEAIRLAAPPSLSVFRGIEDGISMVSCAPDRIVETILDIGRQLHAGGIMPGDCQIISPTRNGPAGITAINRTFHDLKLARQPAPSFPGRPDIAAGDPIIWTRNDHDRELMNGSLGRLLSVTKTGGIAELDGRLVELDAAAGNLFELAYAISVHKAQGSQWERVIVPIFDTRLLDRALLYTAITRAARQVVLVGDHGLVSRAVGHDVASSRQTGIAARLAGLAE